MGETLIEDVNEIREYVRKLKRSLSPEGFKKTARNDYFHGKIRERFEWKRRVNSFVESVIQGETTFYEGVCKYTKPDGKTLYPHVDKIDRDELKNIEMCLGDFYANNLHNVFANPVSGIIGPFAVLYGLSGLAYTSSGKKMPRRKFLKVLGGLSVGGGIIPGGMSSGKRQELYKKAEDNAKLLDYYARQLYPKKPVITEERAQELTQMEVNRFYRVMEEEGYKLKPIPELGDPEQGLRDLFYKRLKENFRIQT